MPVRFQVDPDFYDHPKTAGMSDAAFSLWVRAGSFSTAKRTDGFVSEAVLVHTLRSGTQVADELVERGLWRRKRGGYVFHQWEQRNLTKHRIEEHNAAEAERKRKERQNKKPQVNGHNVRPDADRTPGGVPPDSNTVGVGVGVEDGYVSLESPVEQRACENERPFGDVIPDDWEPNARHRMHAARCGLDLDYEAAQFRSHALDKGRISQNWAAAFDSWLGRAGVQRGSRLHVVNGTPQVHRDGKTGRAVEW